MAAGGCFVKQAMAAGLAVTVQALQSGREMTQSKPATSREERLAAQLRENLRRRKAQARAQNVDDAAEGESVPTPESGLSNSDV